MQLFTLVNYLFPSMGSLHATFILGYSPLRSIQRHLRQRERPTGAPRCLKAPQPLPTFCIQFDLYCLPWLAQSCRQVNTARSHEWKPQSETARLHCIYLWNLTLCFQSLVTIHSLTSYSIWACLIFQLGVGTCFRDWISICHGSVAGVTATLFSEFSHNMSNLHRTWCYANVVKEQNNLLGTKHLHVEFPEQFKEQYVFGMWWSH